ncbi:MAG: hypothetical protein ACXWG4_12515, partial [Thermoanaerobaculia bacterium]
MIGDIAERRRRDRNRCHPEPAERGEGPPASGAGVAYRRGSFAVFAAQDDTFVERSGHLIHAPPQGLHGTLVERRV